MLNRHNTITVRHARNVTCCCSPRKPWARVLLKAPVSWNYNYEVMSSKGDALVTAVTLPGEIKQQPERIVQLELLEPHVDIGKRQLLQEHCKTKSKTLTQQSQKGIQPTSDDVAAEDGVTLSSLSRKGEQLPAQPTAICTARA